MKDLPIRIVADPSIPRGAADDIARYVDAFLAGRGEEGPCETADRAEAELREAEADEGRDG